MGIRRKKEGEKGKMHEEEKKNEKGLGEGKEGKKKVRKK